MLSKYRYYLSSIPKLLFGLSPWQRVFSVFARLTPPGKHRIEVVPSGIMLYTRGVMDIWSVKETFLDRFYERFGTPIGEGWTMVDVGGGIGDFTILAARASKSNRVYAFEPTPGSYALLCENLSLNNIENAQAFQEAVWSEPGDITIDTTTGEPGQFVSRTPGDHAGQISVPATSLDAIFNRLSIERCDLLKLDCEGAEYPILFSLPDEAWGKIDRIVMEYHDNVVERTHEDLARLLREHGYQVQVQPNYVHNYLGYLYAWKK